jgi:hypothetical protein
MQRLSGRSGAPEPRGAEAWLPALALAVTHLALVVALVWFLVVAKPMQGRIALPKATIPGAMAVAVVLAIFMSWRAWKALRTLRNAFRNR